MQVIAWCVVTIFSIFSSRKRKFHHRFSTTGVPPKENELRILAGSSAPPRQCLKITLIQRPAASKFQKFLAGGELAVQPRRPNLADGTQLDNAVYRSHIQSSHLVTCELC